MQFHYLLHKHSRGLDLRGVTTDAGTGKGGDKLGQSLLFLWPLSIHAKSVSPKRLQLINRVHGKDRPNDSLESLWHGGFGAGQTLQRSDGISTPVELNISENDSARCGRAICTRSR